MNTERWEEVARIHALALEHEPPARQEFLDQACHGDPELRREIEELLAQDESPGLMDRPMWDAASQVLEDAPALAPGTFLGPYRIDALAGEGGMGQVFRATDSRLNRSVAIKILPPHVAIDPQLRERFGREAQASATLAHPHICTLYDVGAHDGIEFIVMEYLTGETLAARLDKGRLPLDRALRYAIEIASALDHAHRHGIIHRDVKPANVMLTAGGAKLMDFGVAKLRSSRAADSVSTSLTGAGMILGTVHYMAPEQVEGKGADARSDIFALGAVVYEMATGQRAFEGKSAASVMAAILERQPPAMATLQPVTPPMLDHVVRRCLAKDPDDRWQSAGDVMRELQWIAETVGAQTPSSTAGNATRRMTFRWLPWAAVVALGVTLAVVVALWAPWRLQPAPAPVRFGLLAPSGLFGLTVGPNDSRRFAISPDGTSLVHSQGGADMGTQLVVRRFDRLDVEPLGVGVAGAPFFSPDGRWVGFFDIRAGELKKVSIAGGPPITVCRCRARSASWGPNDIIVFATDNGGGLMSVPAAGGEPSGLTTPDRSRNETDHRFPSILPGGRAVLFTVVMSHELGRLGDMNVAVLDLETGGRKTLIPDGSNGEYVETGHLLYTSTGTLFAVPFDAARLEVLSDPLPVVRDVAVSRQLGAAQYAVSRTGTLVYMPVHGIGTAPTVRSLVWVDRDGREERIPAPERLYHNLRLSPDGTRIALDVRDQDNIDTWIWDFPRQTLTRLTFNPRVDPFPIWTADGQRVVTGDGPGLVWRSADGSGRDEPLTTSDRVHFPMSFSADGKGLIVKELRGANDDLYLLNMDNQKLSPLLTAAYNEGPADLSPDGRWLAYQSDESGRREIYVRPFPDVNAGRWQVSPDGGTYPAWARNGRELFYVDRTEGFTSVPIQTTPAFRAGDPVRLFESRYFMAGQSRSYDVSPDGRRFLFIKDLPPVGPPAATTPANLVVVLNWFEELKSLVPTN